MGVIVPVSRFLYSACAATSLLSLHDGFGDSLEISAIAVKSNGKEFIFFGLVQCLVMKTRYATS